jgi:hypothetical protein
VEVLKWARNQWDRVGSVALIAVGLLALMLGWLGLSRSALPAEQVPYAVSGGVLAIVLVIVGSTLWLSADLRDEWRKLDSLESALDGTGTKTEQPTVTSLEDGRRVARGAG